MIWRHLPNEFSVVRGRSWARGWRIHCFLCVRPSVGSANLNFQTGCRRPALWLLPSDAGPALRDRPAVPPSGINLQPASALWFICMHPYIVTNARPFPFLRTLNQATPHRIHGDVFHCLQAVPICPQPARSVGRTQRRSPTAGRTINNRGPGSPSEIVSPKSRGLEKQVCACSAEDALFHRIAWSRPAKGWS